jgi:penicillin-binding protein 2
MLIFDQLKKNDRQLRLLAVVIFACLAVLLTGLWWVQIVRARDYQASLETQTFRSVRVPSVRGKILDRNGEVLAENRPNYNLSLYLEELSRSFRKEYARLRPTKVVTNELPFWKEWLGVSNVKTQRLKLTRQESEALEWQARYAVLSNVTQRISTILSKPLLPDTNKFKRHYTAQRALPYPMVTGLAPQQIARFEEHFPGTPAADLEVLSTRVYPHGATASHLLGYLVYDDSSMEGEDAYFSYRLPDYRGAVGIEGGLDKALRGRAGAKSVVVNSLGYRQADEIWAAAEPGHNVMLTIDLRIQQAAERALKIAGYQVQGAVVVMDVNRGDILALVSSPATDPNYFITNFPSLAEYSRWTNEVVRMQRNRATQEHYHPGSIFKTLVGLACLEAGLNPSEVYQVQSDPINPSKGVIYIGRDRHGFKDLAAPGDYDFTRAIAKSSNSYFITNGLRFGAERIVELGQRLHLGQRMGLPTRQEAAGHFPTMKRVNTHWRPGDTANLCIGQGDIDVTPLQMAVMTAALANGGKVLWPRLVARIESADLTSTEPPQVFAEGRVRDHLGVSERSLRILKDAMLADTEHPEGTAYGAFRVYSRTAGLMRVCGKTGTAQVKDQQGRLEDHITWFISFAPYESPRYAVVVMVESGGSGGGTCAPVAREIYTAIQQIEAATAGKALARTP